MDYNTVVSIVLVNALIFGLFTAVLAVSKGRNEFVAFFAGAVFSFMGFMLYAAMPALPADRRR